MTEQNPVAYVERLSAVSNWAPNQTFMCASCDGDLMICFSAPHNVSA